MPTGTKVNAVYQALLKKGYSKEKAARIAQSQTGEALATGRPPKHVAAANLEPPFGVRPGELSARQLVGGLRHYDRSTAANSGRGERYEHLRSKATQFATEAQSRGLPADKLTGVPRTPAQKPPTSPTVAFANDEESRDMLRPSSQRAFCMSNEEMETWAENPQTPLGGFATRGDAKAFVANEVHPMLAQQGNYRIAMHPQEDTGALHVFHPRELLASVIRPAVHPAIQKHIDRLVGLGWNPQEAKERAAQDFAGKTSPEDIAAAAEQHELRPDYFYEKREVPATPVPEPKADIFGRGTAPEPLAPSAQSIGQLGLRRTLRIASPLPTRPRLLAKTIYLRRSGPWPARCDWGWLH